MKTETLVALLGRPLTPIEEQNKDLYIKIAKENLGTLICSDLCGEDVRYFDARQGYRTVFVDIFTDVESVRINGNTVTNYSKRQWDRRSGSWYNSLVFDKKFRKDEEVEIEATWGFTKMPADLQQVLAQLFGLISKKNKFDSTIASKQVEDFRISFRADADLDADFYKNYGPTISKYSLCNIGNIKHGKANCKC